MTFTDNDLQNNLSLKALEEVLKGEPSFRKGQILETLVGKCQNDYQSMTSLPKSLRDKLDKELKASVLAENRVMVSKDKKSAKALLRLQDGELIESVLMENLKQNYTICVSSQAGCPVGCAFCATGKMKKFRSLEVLELTEQYCFWKRFISKQSDSKRISNIVFMGMGEPLFLYDTVKQCIKLWLQYTDIGPNYITVSTVGILPSLEKILKDPDWPSVKIAISFHSADQEIRKKLIPFHQADFFEKLREWIIAYHRTHGARTRPITLEYVMLSEVNDRKEDALKFIKFLKDLPRIKVNLIPYNESLNSTFNASSPSKILKFQNALKQAGITVTVRKSLGQDIQAACGQLVAKTV